MKQRLTSIETLPAGALPDCQWLYDVIKACRMTQVEMIEEFNRRLKDGGYPETSLSGLNRYVIKVRSGCIRRPEPIRQYGNVGETAIFSDAFRLQLVEKQGLHATTLLEAALSALIQPRAS